MSSRRVVDAWAEPETPSSPTVQPQPQQSSSNTQTITVELVLPKRVPTYGMQVGTDRKGQAMITIVTKGSAAATAGLLSGDIITAINGTSLARATPREVATLLEQPKISLVISRKPPPSRASGNLPAVCGGMERVFDCCHFTPHTIVTLPIVGLSLIMKWLYTL